MSLNKRKSVNPLPPGHKPLYLGQMSMSNILCGASCCDQLALTLPGKLRAVFVHISDLRKAFAVSSPVSLKQSTQSSVVSPVTLKPRPELFLAELDEYISVLCISGKKQKDNT